MGHVTLANKIRFRLNFTVDGQARRAARASTRKRGEADVNNVPEETLGVLILFAVAFLPAALGAASGYGPSRGRGVERRASAEAGAYFFSGIATALGLTALLCYLLSEMVGRSSSQYGLLSVIAGMVFLGVFGLLALMFWLFVCTLAKIGAGLGARFGRFTSALLAGTLAGVGATAFPAVLGWLK